MRSFAAIALVVSLGVALACASSQVAERAYY